MSVFFSKFKFKLFITFIAMAFISIMYVYIGSMLNSFSQKIQIVANSPSFYILGTSLLISVLTLSIASYTCDYMTNWIAYGVLARLRKKMFGHVLHLDVELFETRMTGDIISTIFADSYVIREVIGSSLSALNSSISLLSALFMVSFISLQFGVILAAVFPIVIVPLFYTGKKLRRVSRCISDQNADALSYAEEAINNINTCKIFSHEKQCIDVFSQKVDASRSSLNTLSMTSAIFSSGKTLLTYGGVILTIIIGRSVLGNEKLFFSHLAYFTFYIFIAISSACDLTRVWSVIQRASGAAERILDLLAFRSRIAGKNSTRILSNPSSGKVEIKSVTFYYKSIVSRAAICDFSLNVARGETVALVGPSGAGKSTLFKLLMRFYDPQIGAVLLDDVNIKDIDPQFLRSRISIVAQDPVIFSANGWENIRYGRPEASNEEVRRAAEAASADFLDDLPEGFDTFLGEKGVRLSGGQRQRLAIARAILRNPSILLLDEATSALDSESERKVQMALAELSVGRTTLVAAHRISTVMTADRIVVIDRGRIAAIGKHDELMRHNELYEKLVKLQFLASERPEVD